LAETRTTSLCGEGHLHAELMLIAQAPGEQKDKEGKMFIGPSGKVLNDLLRMVHIDCKEIYMTNLIKSTLVKNYRTLQVLYTRLSKETIARKEAS